ncbi:lipid droplet-associated hydrolase-like [Gigantopelta aegis]|uniref:lipid droplet-associated hydrolase-like n=1 Tax=Gigantopelta aegis TaxID=1735272 RepID=UPI001B88DD40|nr:lipid droplet-associated hydrolase-like [Gigantopelta aegis]XP_041361091.1 lipid droplet-associated hydrolase-like [Gigantopelta aegis]
MERCSEMRTEFCSILGGSTHIIKFGQLPNKKQHAPYIFLVIPGNPGIIEYYEEFLRVLYFNTGSRIPVWGISHAGHVSVPKSASGFSEILKDPPGVFSLGGQIKHKIEFIMQRIPDNVRLILIGHSIGCYMILKLMDQVPHKILRCFLLFPTIERMALSPQGVYVAPLLYYLRWLAVLAVKALSYLSPHVQYRLILRYFKDFKVPECALNATMSLFDPVCVNKATFMANQEMQQVTRLPEDIIRKNISKLSFYYGSCDHWCPKEYCYQLKRKFPHADIYMCQNDFSHAYVLEASDKMADIIWSWIQKDLHKLKD